jgi:hypothetical protein
MITEEKAKVLELFKQGRKLYIMRKFDEAKDAFAKALQIDAEDGPSKVYYKRCKHYIENPPPDDWDGVWVMTTK